MARLLNWNRENVCSIRTQYDHRLRANQRPLIQLRSLWPKEEWPTRFHLSAPSWAFFILFFRLPSHLLHFKFQLLYPSRIFAWKIFQYKLKLAKNEHPRTENDKSKGCLIQPKSEQNTFFSPTFSHIIKVHVGCLVSVPNSNRKLCQVETKITYLGASGWSACFRFGSDSVGEKSLRTETLGLFRLSQRKTNKKNLEQYEKAWMFRSLVCELDWLKT